ncbi:methionine ABC transporter substrate-binding protein [Vibrio ishigakensis]|uniref:Methionine ABC transporter substrate-binding protein n=1 Tax=Vibrio ishigakensis TaxID=1481914 RepID=A0A0B8PG53_9VIBR|nr:methionine ABC transporter substrate-binding protein [Vibrio ishigakensis]
MKFTKKITLPLLVSALAFSLTGCGKQDDSVIKIGATVGPHAQVVEAVAKEAEKQGINIEVVEFSDYITRMQRLPMGASI